MQASPGSKANKQAMKMMTCIAASILLMLSLEASLAVADDVVGSILLPSQGKGIYGACMHTCRELISPIA